MPYWTSSTANEIFNSSFFVPLICLLRWSILPSFNMIIYWFSASECTQLVSIFYSFQMRKINAHSMILSYWIGCCFVFLACICLGLLFVFWFHLNIVCQFALHHVILLIWFLGWSCGCPYLSFQISGDIFFKSKEILSFIPNLFSE